MWRVQPRSKSVPQQSEHDVPSTQRADCRAGETVSGGAPGTPPRPHPVAAVTVAPWRRGHHTRATLHSRPPPLPVPPRPPSSVAHLSSQCCHTVLLPTSPTYVRKPLALALHHDQRPPPPAHGEEVGHPARHNDGAHHLHRCRRQPQTNQSHRRHGGGAARVQEDESQENQPSQPPWTNTPPESRHQFPEHSDGWLPTHTPPTNQAT